VIQAWPSSKGTAQARSTGAPVASDSRQGPARARTWASPIGAIIYIPGGIDSEAADQAAIESSSAIWGDVLDYETSQSATDAAFEAAADLRIALSQAEVELQKARLLDS
jgi:hypothetical protein